MKDLFIVALGEKQKRASLEKWPELDEERVNYNYNSFAWQRFNILRENAVIADKMPNKSQAFSLKKSGAWLIWLSTLIERCAYDEMNDLSPDLMEYSFKSSLQMIRNEWLSNIETFIPEKYREFFDDQEGWVSAIEDPYELLWFTLPNHHMDDDLWRYRRWLARRDWFLANLGIIVAHYRDSLHYFDIAADFDKYLKPARDGFKLYELSNGKRLPLRELTWREKTIQLHTSWNKKGMPSLLFKILRKDYSYNGSSIFTDVYDILRARFVVEEKDLGLIQFFIAEQYPELKLKERKNDNTSNAFRVLSYSGKILGQKFELHVQTFHDYQKSQHEVGEIHHLVYKAKQFYKLLNLMLPSDLISHYFQGFDYTSEEFRQAYQNHVLTSI